MLRILVTGGSGFVGKELVIKAIGCGYDIINIDLVPSNIRGITEYIHDLSISPVDIGSVDMCFHLANAAGGVLFNYHTDIIEYNDNINKNTFKSCDSPIFVFVSSINVLESSEDIFNIVKPISPYAVSKFVGEQFFKTCDIENLFIIRPTNIFGKSQITKFQSYGESHVIPDLIHKIQQGSDVEVWGNGTQVRNFLHVADLCDFMIGISNNMPSQMENNLKSKITMSIRELADSLAKFMNKNVNFHYIEEYMKYELIDINRISPHMMTIGIISDIENGLRI